MSVQPDNPSSALDLAVIDYGMGNLRSVLRAFERVGGKPRLVASPAEAKSADALVFPGQGAIVDCMRLLKETKLDHTIREWIAADRPFFGVCLGLQALFEHSEEGNTPGLGIFPGQVVRFQLPPPFKIPHMGWNDVRWAQSGSGEPGAGRTKPGAGSGERGVEDPDPMLAGIAPESDQFYFVHSYYAQPADRALIWGETNYGGNFCSAIRRGNCLATQFHPEKSQAKGLQLYRNFIACAARAPKKK